MSSWTCTFLPADFPKCIPSRTNTGDLNVKCMRVISLTVCLFKCEVHASDLSHHVFVCCVFVPGVGMEGKCVGKREGDSIRTIHSGTEQTEHTGRCGDVHTHHQQHHRVRLPVHIQLHRVEFIRTWDHDHHTGRDRWGYVPAYAAHTLYTF